MTEPIISSRLFGKLMREALGAGPSRVTLAAQRARLIAAVSREMGRRSSHRPGWLFAAALTAAAAAACLLLVWSGGLRDDTVRVTFRGSPVTESAAVETKPAEAQPLAFSEGSEVTLASATQAELSRLTPKTADLRLKQGRLLANIRKNTGLTWTIAVGPYSVRVVGTRFSVDWDRDQQHLQVAVREGRVRVFGGDLPGDGVALDAGSRLDRRYGVVRSEPAPKPDPAPVSTPAAREATRAPGNPAPAIAMPNLEPSWLGLATKGKYRDALALAEKQGFDQLTLTLPENELVTLANAARFSGDSDRARRALLKLRQRFPGRPAAQLGALYLARVAEDVEKKPTEALRWLRVFLQESPTGDLAASARTSLMNILLNTGDAQGARAIAEDYVRYHPNGRHLSQARALLAQPRLR